MPGPETCDQSHVLGRWRLVLADCRDWLRRQPERSIEAVVTDPPYGLGEYEPSELGKLRSGRGGLWRQPPALDGSERAPLPRFTVMSEAEVQGLWTFFRDWVQALDPVLVPGAHVMLASNPLVSSVVGHALWSAGLERRGQIIRLVQTMRGGDRPKNAEAEFAEVSVMPRSQHEPWLLFRKPLEGRVQDNLRRFGTGALRRLGPEQPFGDVIASAPTQKAERALAPHPSLKPQAFMRQLVRASLPLGLGTVLDPFAGSGSTLAAAEHLGYRSVGVERDRDYFTLAGNAISDLAALGA